MRSDPETSVCYADGKDEIGIQRCCGASDGASKSLKIITDGCMENLDDPTLLAEINPESSGQELKFNQFAFADANEG